MKRTVPLIVVLACTACASAPAPGPAAPADSAAQGSTPGEEFDPEALQEDLLLIDPVFPQPAAPQPTAAAPTPAVQPVPTREPRSQPGPAVAAEGQWLYRVQVMALSNPGAAAQLRSQLESELDQPVRVDTERGRYLVRIGAFATDAEAHRYAEQLADAHPEHADAYVVSVPADTAAVDSTGALVDSLAAWPTARLVPAFGWRIQVGQFLSHDQAEVLRRKAVERLGRTDIEITFRAPWYKVEVGNFRSEGHAQDAFQNLRARYPDALVVRSQILVPADE